jgi:hypothetical protein
MIVSLSFLPSSPPPMLIVVQVSSLHGLIL